MANTVRNEYDKMLTPSNLMDAHLETKKHKGSRLEVIKFELKKEEYIYWLYEQLKYGRYIHGEYTSFYIYRPKVRLVEKARYLDRIVHRWVVDNFLIPHFEPQFIHTTYACIKGRGMHKACLDVQKTMRYLEGKWGEYYIIKMDVAKYFGSINKEILFSILERKIKDKKLIWLIGNILKSNIDKKELWEKNKYGIPIRKLYITVLCKYIFK